jgi:polysaccharide export outer membrane protein
MTTRAIVNVALAVAASLPLLTTAAVAEAQRSVMTPGAAAPTTAAPVGPAFATPSSPAASSPAASAPTAVVPGASVALPSEYVIGPGDVLQVSVWKNETLSRIVPVRPDGKISMPLLHDITASGLTAMQLRDKIARALAEFLPNPEVSVSVNEVRSMHVSVLGEVQKPGVLELRGATTILEAIAMAGGFRDFASPSKIVVLRNEPNGKTQRIRFNYNRAVSNAAEEQNITLKSGDVVVVP